MRKRDPIFWWAAGIFALALLLFYVTQIQDWLFLGILSYLLRPTLASLGVAKRYVDERQMTINYRSGNIAFAATILTCVIIAVKLAIEDDHAFEYFRMAIIVGLATKALFNVILIKNFREAAQKILIGVGLLVALFASFSSFHPWSPVSFLMNILPGLAIAGIGLLSIRHPRPAGALILAATAVLLWKILSRPGFDWGSIATAVIIGVPLIIGGAYLLRCETADADTELDGEAQ
jgi:hypothetical protein